MEDSSKLMQARIEQLENELFECIEREKKLEKIIEETGFDRARAGKRIDEANLHAEEIKKETDYRYYLSLKALKNFTDKCHRIGSSPYNEENKKLIGLFADLLKDLTFENSEEKFEKASTLLGFDSSPVVASDDYVFDLDAVINPTENLSLEELCKELGVYKG